MNDRPKADAKRLSSHALRNGGVCLPRSRLRRRLVGDDYYRSTHWRDVRTRYLASKLWKGACLGCGTETPSPHVHHRSYRRAFEERLTDLAGLCGHCHAWIHHLEREASWKNLWELTSRVIRARGTQSPYRSPHDR